MRRHVFFCALLTTAVALVYAQTAGFEFVEYDDDRYITNNPQLELGFNAEGLRWAISEGGATRLTFWQPVTWLSLMLDHALYGLDGGGFHLTNVLLHLINTLLLYGALYYMTGAVGRSAFVAGLFALHPLHVEPVAWVSERKELLSVFFGLLSLWSYALYARRRNAVAYVATTAFLALGLMAKATIVTLPFVFLLLDLWPLDRSNRSNPPVSWKRLVLEKLPFFALAVGSATVTLWARLSGAAVHPPTSVVPLVLRAANALVSYVRYLGKTLWPEGLTPLYPHPYMPEMGGTPWAVWQVAAAALLLLGISALVFRSGRRYAVVGWLWYLGTLVPMIGLVHFAPQGMADRFTYLPLIGLFLLLAWGGNDCLERLVARRPKSATLLRALPWAILGLCILVSWQQVRHWRDSLTLFTHAVRVTPNSPDMLASLGNALFSQGDVDGAIEHYERSLAIFPNYAEQHYNLANAFIQKRDVESAIRHYRLALDLKPQLTEVRANLASALLLAGSLDEAIAHYREALAQKEWPEAHGGLAAALMRRREHDAAIHHFQRAVELDLESTDAHSNLARALELTGDRRGAARHYQQALRLAPDNARAVQGIEHLNRRGDAESP